MFCYQVDDETQGQRGNPVTGKSWRAPQCPFAIAYSGPLLEEIAREAEGSLNSPRGETETGGVLFGKSGLECVEILAFRPLPCEHALGPGFILSPKDEARLADLKLACGTDAALAGLEPVGWYHSHVASRIFLSERDLQVHNRHFGAPLQVALVLRPHADRPTRAGFFFRDAAGQVQADASYQEFTVETPPPEAGRPQASSSRDGASSQQASSAAKPQPQAQALVCPRCGSGHIRRSHRANAFERLRGIFGYRPYRCHECLSRSFLKTAEVLDSIRPSAHKRPEERRRARQRTRREVLLWGGGTLGFLAILYYLVRDNGPKQDQP